MTKKEIHAELIKKVKDMENNKSGYYKNNIRGNEEWFQYRKKRRGPDAFPISAWNCYRLRNIKKDKGDNLQGHNEFHALYKDDLYNWAKLNNLKVKKNMKYREMATIIYRNT